MVRWCTTCWRGSISRPQRRGRLVRTPGHETCPTQFKVPPPSWRAMIERFVASPSGRRLAGACRCSRKWNSSCPGRPWLGLQWPSRTERRAQVGQTSGAGRYFRGYVDCLYQDDAGTWHIMDYKTNDVSAAQVPVVAGQYEMQLYVYALAAERVLGESPVELVLHFLRPGVDHVFAWNDQSPSTRHCNDNDAHGVSSTPTRNYFSDRLSLGKARVTHAGPFFTSPSQNMADLVRQRAFALEIVQKLRGRV